MFCAVFFTENHVCTQRILIVLPVFDLQYIDVWYIVLFEIYNVAFVLKGGTALLKYYIVLKSDTLPSDIECLTQTELKGGTTNKMHRMFGKNHGD